MNITFRMVENRMDVPQPRAESWYVALIDAGDGSMTGGRLLRVADHLRSEDAFCMTYGDRSARGRRRAARA